jgi:cell division septal protein FtsQ
MTYSSYQRRTPRRSTTRRRTRRVNVMAGGTMTQPKQWLDTWMQDRPRLIAIGLILLIGLSAFWVFNTDTFYVYKLDVVGTGYLTAAEIEQASGIMNYNIFFVDARSVERALAKLPEVKTVRVTTNLPNRVSINIVERKPEITWLRGNEMYWVDVDGIGFRARTNLAELPVIRDLDQTTVKPGQPIHPDAINAFWAFRRAWVDGPRNVEWSNARGLTFTDERGWKIYLGDANEMAGKLAKLRALVAQLVAQNARIRFIDLGRGEPYYQ